MGTPTVGDMAESWPSKGLSKSRASRSASATPVPYRGRALDDLVMGLKEGQELVKLMAMCEQGGVF